MSVRDNGRGIPVEIHPKTGISTAETVYTVLHAGGKFGGDSGYKISGGLHGVGASVVNALSSWAEVTVERDGGIYQMTFEFGKTVKPLEKIGESKKYSNNSDVVPFRTSSGAEYNFAYNFGSIAIVKCPVSSSTTNSGSFFSASTLVSATIKSASSAFSVGTAKIGDIGVSNIETISKSVTDRRTVLLSFFIQVCLLQNFYGIFSL